MAPDDKSLSRIQAPTVISQPVSIGPRQADRDKKDESRKGRKQRPAKASIDETLQEEKNKCQSEDDDQQSHIDYRA